MIQKPKLCLGIDTASDTTSVALVAGDGRFVDTQMTSSRGQGEVLMDMIANLFQQMEKQPSDLTQIAVTIGPGSFTGVRIGLATARGLGLALNIPVLGVNNFMATAFGISAPIKVVLDSKREEFFVQDFKKHACPQSEPSFQTATDLRKELPFIACGSGAKLLAEKIHCVIQEPVQSLALSAAQIALKHPQRTKEPHPLYLREADVTI